VLPAHGILFFSREGNVMEMRKRLLLVNDVRLFLEMERSFFSRDQVEITVARDGAEALQALPVLKPHLVIMDLFMPVMDGAEACRRIKADPSLASIPVILTTLDDNPAELRRCHAAGCDEVIVRPLNRRHLLQTARRYLDLAERTMPRVPSRMLVHYGVEDQQTLHDFSVNLAAGGVFLETLQMLPVDTPLTLEFFIPGATATIRCKGRVAWINPAGEPPKLDLPCGLGVQFIDMPPRDEQAIREFIQTECGSPS
jgi:uncharacterized protein (TIGR02266 family)